jgi:dUTP pyrophosphatase
MSVDTATVAKIAALARIKVTESELAAMVPELNGILAWVEQLGEVDVTGVEPMTAVIENHLRLRDDASLPQGAYPGDAGLDLVACERVELGPGERGVVSTGIAVAIPEGYAGLVIPRSGLALEHGISLVNTPGLIDSGYRGELRVIALNTDRDRSFTVEAGMRIAQLVVTPVPEVDVVVLDELPETVRGAAGFGSSGA